MMMIIVVVPLLVFDVDWHVPLFLSLSNTIIIEYR